MFCNDNQDLFRILNRLFLDPLQYGLHGVSGVGFDLCFDEHVDKHFVHATMEQFDLIVVRQTRDTGHWMFQSHGQDHVLTNGNIVECVARNDCWYWYWYWCD